MYWDTGTSTYKIGDNKITVKTSVPCGVSYIVCGERDDKFAQETPFIVEEDKEELARAVRRVSTLSNALTHQVKFHLKDDNKLPRMLILEK